MAIPELENGYRVQDEDWNEIVDAVNATAPIKALTQTEYDALSTSEKNNGTVYLIQGGGIRLNGVEYTGGAYVSTIDGLVSALNARGQRCPIMLGLSNDVAAVLTGNSNSAFGVFYLSSDSYQRIDFMITTAGSAFWCGRYTVTDGSVITYRYSGAKVDL